MAFDSNQLQQLLEAALKQQQGYVGGLSSVNLPSTNFSVNLPQTNFQTPTSLGLSGQFQPTLDEMLRTGAPVNTQALKAAMEASARQAFGTEQSSALSSLASMGLVGSSAQTAELGRALERLGTNIGLGGAQIDYSAGEAAAGRRMGAMPLSLQQGGLNLDLGRLGLQGQQAASAENIARAGLQMQGLQGTSQENLARAGLQQQGLFGQAGAGQDLASLLASLGMSAGGRTGGGGGLFGGADPLEAQRAMQNQLYMDQIMRDRSNTAAAEGRRVTGVQAEQEMQRQRQMAAEQRMSQFATMSKLLGGAAETKYKDPFTGEISSVGGRGVPIQTTNREQLANILAAFGNRSGEIGGLANMNQAAAQMIQAMNQGNVGMAQAMSPVWQTQAGQAGQSNLASILSKLGFSVG